MNNALATTLAQVTTVMQAQTKAIHQMNKSGTRVVTNSIMPLNPQYIGLSEFRRNDPPFFRGSANPLEAEEQLQKLEKFFRVMRCDDAQKVDFATYILESDAKHWWYKTRGSLATWGTPIT